MCPVTYCEPDALRPQCTSELKRCKIFSGDRSSVGDSTLIL